MRYESRVRVNSKVVEGVSFTVKKMSFGRRLDLLRRVGDLLSRLEYLEGGEGTKEKIEAALLAGEVDRVYLEWGLDSIEGLTIDGEEPTVAVLVERGPEELVREIIEVVKRESGLSEEERKNSSSPSTF